MMTLIDFVYRKVPPPKTWSDKCLKSRVSEDPSTSNMVNLPVHCWNQHHRTFSILIDHCQVNWVGKSLSYWHAKSWDADQKYPVLNRKKFNDTSSDAIMSETKTFSQFFTAFLKCRLNSKYFQKEDDPHRFSISEITDSEHVVR